MAKAGIVHCPNKVCQKPIISKCMLAEGTSFVIKCPSCQEYVKIIASFNFIQKKLLQKPSEYSIINHEAVEN